MTRPLFVLALALFATMLGNGVVMPFLPLYAQQFSASGAVVGALFGAHSAARTFLLPLIGRSSDRYGRKTFLLGGLLFYTLTSIAYLLANSLSVLLLVMALQGIATAMVQPVALAYVADLTPKGKEGAYAGYANTAFMAGVAGGPILGGVIKDLYSMHASFVTLGVLSFLSFLLLWLLLPESQPHGATTQTRAAPWRAILSSRQIVGVSFFRIVYALASTIIWVFVPLLAAHVLPLSTTQVGVLISLNVLVSTLLQPPCGRLADRVNKSTLIVIGGTLSAFALIGFPLASDFWHLLILNILVGVGFGVAYPSHIALAMEHAPGASMGAVMSVLLTVHSLTMTIAPLIFGFIVDRYTLSSVFYSAGGLSLIAVIVCYTLTRAATRLTPVIVAPVEKPVVTESTRPSTG
jgi:DHA1 family multidrug resistance protein-like MFS transporter